MIQDFKVVQLIPAGISLLVFAVILAVWTFILVPISLKVTKKTKAQWLYIFIKSFKKPISVAIIISAIVFSAKTLTFIPFFSTGAILNVWRVAMIYCNTWGLVKAKGVVRLLLTSKSDNARNETIILFVTRIYVVLIVVFAFLMALSDLNFDVTGILTGLGLGSLTIALAAQDVASNFFGGFIIILERPFEVGDWITADIIEGSVEDITFRSTKIRTIDGSLTVVPNNKLASGALTNWTKLEHRLLRFNLGLTYNTKKETVNDVSRDIQNMLNNHSAVETDTIEVVLSEFANSSIDIMITMYIKHVEIKPYRQAVDDINYKIMDIMEKNNASFAFPSQSVYFENTLSMQNKQDV